jgi:hypothetical protein
MDGILTLYDVSFQRTYTQNSKYCPRDDRSKNYNSKDLERSPDLKFEQCPLHSPLLAIRAARLRANGRDQIMGHKLRSAQKRDHIGVPPDTGEQNVLLPTYKVETSFSPCLTGTLTPSLRCKQRKERRAAPVEQIRREIHLSILHASSDPQKHIQPTQDPIHQLLD